MLVFGQRGKHESHCTIQVPNYCIMSFLVFSQNSQSMQRHRLFLCDVDATNSTILGTIIIISQLRVPQVVTLTYNLSVEIKQVDVDALNGTILGTIISGDQATGKSVGLQTGQECLFAYIVYNSNVTHDYMFLEVNVEPRLDAGIGITVSLLLIFNPRSAQRGLVG